MKEKSEWRGAEVQGIEMIELGDAVEETRQNAAMSQFLDNCCQYTYWGE